MRRAIVMLAVAAFVVSQGSALAYSDWGWDPVDPGDQGGGDSLDLAMTRRDVVRHGDGRSTLRYTFDVHGPGLSYWYGATVKLDTRGDRRADYFLYFWDADNSGRGCGTKQVGSSSDGRKGRISRGDDWARCRVPLSRVNPDKRIRWKMRIWYGDDVVDTAPETGWYF